MDDCPGVLRTPRLPRGDAFSVLPVQAYSRVEEVTLSASCPYKCIITDAGRGAHLRGGQHGCCFLGIRPKTTVDVDAGLEDELILGFYDGDVAAGLSQSDLDGAGCVQFDCFLDDISRTFAVCPISHGVVAFAEE